MLSYFKEDSKWENGTVAFLIVKEDGGTRTDFYYDTDKERNDDFRSIILGDKNCEINEGEDLEDKDPTTGIDSQNVE